MSKSIADGVLNDGFAKIVLNDLQAKTLTNLLTQSRPFFAQDLGTKATFASSDGNHGYRAMGKEFAMTAERPDINDSFSIWSDRIDLVPGNEKLGEFAEAILEWQKTVSQITYELLDAIAKKFDQPTTVQFAAASSVQINNYQTAPSDREFLQDKHEDGHIVTLVHGTKPGLELFIDGKNPTKVEIAADELVVMPGSILTALTGDAIKPLYHQVRNLKQSDRQSIMYFVNPELKQPIIPWVAGANEDLRDFVRNRPSEFGLPAVPEL